MKGQILILSAAVILLSLIPFGAIAQGKYVPKANEELYGTWINDKSINDQHIQKQISTSDGDKCYLEVSDSVSFFEDEWQIYSKWTDSEGNIWYKIFGTVKAGAYEGTKWQELAKLSKSSTVWEYVYTIVYEFDPNLYPTKVDPKEGYYRILYRADK